VFDSVLVAADSIWELVIGIIRDIEQKQSAFFMPERLKRTNNYGNIKALALEITTIQPGGRNLQFLWR
jgi:hypothetical protein